MNKIRAIQALNKKEIEQGISTGASWHTDYRDTAFVYFGGLPYELSEGDVITIFSQFGEPVFLKLARDKETGKSKGFGWLKYEDQRSTDLAVDNLGGSDIGGRLISVDHARYKARDDEDPSEFKVGWEDMMHKQGRPVSDDERSEEEAENQTRPLLPEEQELAKLMRDHDDDDPMKAFLIEEKKKEVDEAKLKAEKRKRRSKRRHHRSHRPSGDEPDADRSSRPRESEPPRDYKGRHKDRDSTRHRWRDDSRAGARRGHHADDDDDADEQRYVTRDGQREKRQPGRGSSRERRHSRQETQEK
ncbi:RNA binding domain protein [Ophiocordyceps sinensis CO18]|uniref:RNA binding domain protein n=1 Tax=Ophiocordyceps sinensis (strain Co18 / CGMCC 3.14243) TaxID=911162 RepID=T5AHH5_OPHSC|nr:RNA binding domain protein [Ophiocordyceps sinensis CO18]